MSLKHEIVRVPAIHREVCSDARRLKPREGLYPTQHLLMKDGRLRQLRILLNGKREMHSQKAIRVEAELDLLQAHKAIDHQARSDQQRQGQSKLCNDQQVAQTPPTGNLRAATASAFERLAQIRINVIERRDKAEDQTTEECAERCKAQHEAVHLHLIHTRNGLRTQRQ